MGQGDVSKLERRTDMYVSTLASYLQAVGADLEIRAVFPPSEPVAPPIRRIVSAVNWSGWKHRVARSATQSVQATPTTAWK
jgi:hypothetical protein